MSSIREIVCSFGSLYKAARICKQNVIWKDSVAGFVVVNGLVNCYKLKQQLENGKYKLDGYTIFKVYEPKERTIVSTRIKDRVVQRSLCDNYLTKQISKCFTYDNGACLPDKGTEFARKRLFVALQRHYRKHGLQGGVLKCDLKDYFGSTPHAVAINAIRERVPDEWACSEVARIINSFNQGASPDVGMGLGSQVTQLIQLAVLDDLDHYIKEVLRIKNHVRYMDDFILIHQDKDYLRICREKIRERIKRLGLRLSEKKTQMQPIAQPIHFLGFSYRLTGTGKVIVKILPEKLYNRRRKLRKIAKRVKEGSMTREQADAGYEAFKAHLTGRPTRKRKNRPTRLKRYTHTVAIEMDKFYKNLWEDT